MRFVSYIARRIIGIFGVLLGVSLITFFISHALPADPAAAALSSHASNEQVAQYRRDLGLDRPVVEQYVTYLGGLLRGDFGRSIRTQRPVIDDLRAFLPATVELSLGALLVAVFLGIPLGVLSSLSRNRLPDHFVRLFSLLGGSVPIFFLGLLLISVFYNQLGWFPAGGRIDTFVTPPPHVTGLFVLDSILAGDMDALKSSLHHLILPSFTLGYYSTAVTARMTRSSMLEVLGQDYVRTARAKGLPQRIVVARHALRNALVPIITVVGILFGSLLSGAVLTETVFSWPGLGGYATTSATGVDFPAVMGVTVIAAMLFPVLSMLVDLLYTRLDPRITTS